MKKKTNNISFINDIENEKKTHKQSLINNITLKQHFINQNDTLISEYDKRQIFEMLQNIDDQIEDEKSSECLIELNTQKRFLTFYNNGKPFSTDGIKSIMMPDVSPKKGKKYIGKKGLGFRSILNWSKEIEIYSDGKIFNFSQEIAEGYSNIENIPLLMFPNCSITNINDWDTYVKLKNLNDDNINNIRKELTNFSCNLLLFLNNIQKITIKIDEEESEYSVLKNKKIAENITEKLIFNKMENKYIPWWIFNKDYNNLNRGHNGRNIFLNDEICNIRIAIKANEETSSGYRLYNFFPTQHTIHLPCVLHATLDLDSSRNNILNNDKNEKILTKFIPYAFNEFTEEFLKKQSTNWKAYKLLSATQNSDNDDISEMYTILQQYRDNGEYCPCIDNIYRKKQDVKFYNNEINSYFEDNGWNNVFGELVKKNAPKDIWENIYRTSEFVKKVENHLQETDLNDDETVNLIYKLYEIRKIEKDNNQNLQPYNILKDQKGNPIPSDMTALTSQRNAEQIPIPNYLKFQYLSNGFCDKFYKKFEKNIDSYKQDNAGNPKRSFIKNDICENKLLKITFYDRSNILPLIITQCNELLKNEITFEKKNKIISQMLEALYNNIKNGDDFSDKKIPIYANETKIIYSSDILLPEARNIYGNTLPDDVYLNYEFSTLEFLKNKSDKENFLKILGVQEYIRIEKKKIENGDKYLGFLLDNGLLPRERRRAPLEEDFEVISLKDQEIIKKLTSEKFQKLLKCQVTLQQTFKDLILQENCTIKWIEQGCRNSSLINIAFPYIAYQLRNYAKNMIINVNNQTFNDLGYKNIKIKDSIDIKVFQMLGAKNSLDDFTTEELFSLMNDVKEKNIIPNQAFYKLILATLKNRQDNFENFNNGLYLSAKTKNNGQNFYLNSEIYYDDNSYLAQIFLQKNYPIFILPSKLGAEQVCNIFGVKRIDESLLKIKTIVKSELNSAFQKDFQNYLPYFMAIRINNIQMDTPQKTKYASYLKNIKVELVEQLDYTIHNDNQLISLDENCLYHDKENEKYYIKTTKNIVYDLHKDINFGKCISEILCIELEAISQEREYIICYNNKALYEDLFDEPEFKDEIQKLLGISNDEKTFYGNLIKLWNPQNQNNDEDETEKINHFIKDNNISIDLNSSDNEKKYKQIKEFAKQNNLNPDILVKETENLIDFYAINKQFFEETLKKLLNSFKHQLWDFLNNDGKEMQQFFRKIIEDYTEIIDNNTIIQAACNNNKSFDYDYKTVFINVLKNTEWSNFKNEIKINYDNLNEFENWQEKIYYPDYKNIIDGELYSLLFFENNEEKIKNIIDETPKQPKEDTKTIEKIDLISAEWEIDENPPQTSNPKNQNRKRNNNSGRFNTEIIKRQEEQGKIAEQQVMKYLNDKGFNPQQKSGNSQSIDRDDAVHYDIEYFDKNGELKYVEVKSINNSNCCEFFMSNHEWNFAQEKKNQYILALVDKDNQVYFKDNFVDCVENNKFFNKSTDTWKFSFKKKNKDSK